jgi:hypothetical protein
MAPEGIMRARKKWLAIGSFALVAVRADAASAQRCLEAASDPAEIAATRAQIDAECPCFGSGDRSEHKACAFGVISARVAVEQLRRECRATVKKIYMRSVCGLETTSKGPFAPCVRAVDGRVACTMKAAGRCSTFPLPQLRCYGHLTCLDAADENMDLRIAGPGDTGACAAVADAWTDNGDGTITDRRTTLTWEKLSDDGSIHDWDDLYAFEDAPTVKIAALNATAFAGHSDWRVPTIEELTTLLQPIPSLTVEIGAEFNTGCTPGCTILDCSCTAVDAQSVDGYWSSTDLLEDAAYIVSFSSAAPTGSQKATPHWVRAVRGGS